MVFSEGREAMTQRRFNNTVVVRQKSHLDFSPNSAKLDWLAWMRCLAKSFALFFSRQNFFQRPWWRATLSVIFSNTFLCSIIIKWRVEITVHLNSESWRLRWHLRWLKLKSLNDFPSTIKYEVHMHVCILQYTTCTPPKCTTFLQRSQMNACGRLLCEHWVWYHQLCYCMRGIYF